MKSMSTEKNELKKKTIKTLKEKETFKKRSPAGFRGVDYQRTKSVAEGDDCCDYRLDKPV